MVCAVVAAHAARGGVVAIVSPALLPLMPWRIWNAWIHVERDGVKVVTVFLSREIAWGDIHHFAVLAREVEDGWRAP